MFGVKIACARHMDERALLPEFRKLTWDTAEDSRQ
jgi:hypothetical protein